MGVKYRNTSIAPSIAISKETKAVNNGPIIIGPLIKVIIKLATKHIVYNFLPDGFNL